jgi:hypothetical protein
MSLTASISGCPGWSIAAKAAPACRAAGRLPGETDALVTLQHRREFAAVAAGDEAVALADGGRDVRDLEAGRLARMNGTAQRLEGFHEERAHEKGLEAAGLGLFHLLLHGEEALGAHGFLRQGVAVRGCREACRDRRRSRRAGETGANFRLVAVADGLQEQVLEADALENFAKNVEDAAIERGALDTPAFQKPEINITFAGFLGDEIPEVADLLLADAVDAAEALFEAVRIPRQVVIDHQVGVLKVDAFTGGVGGDQDANFGVGTKDRLNAAALIAVGAAVDGDDGVAVAQHSGNFLVQIVQCVAVLGKDDELALATAGIAHGGVVLQDAGEFVPFAVLPRGDDSFGLMFESLEDDDFLLQLGDGARRGGLIDQVSSRFSCSSALRSSSSSGTSARVSA